MSRDALRRRVTAMVVGFGVAGGLLFLAPPPRACWAAGYRTANFVVQAATPELAREVALAAETFRRELAREWLGHDLRDWHEPCPITVQAAPRLPAGGETSFVFDRGYPSHWQMRVQGTRERILDSVLPHEVTHTVFATHFGQPLPRWADEGACTTVEHESERAKQQHLLIQFLTTERGIPFRHMFAMRDYPSDILPLYSQGYSLARFLIAQGGKPKFIAYLEDGMRTREWHATTARHYGFRNLGDLQLSWLDWVKQGSPPEITPPSSDQLARAETSAVAALEASPARPRDTESRPAATLVSAPNRSDSFYVRQAAKAQY